MDDPSLTQAVAAAAANEAFLAALRRILDDADAAARRQGFDCRACGECCLFEQYGHRLYVSTGELALLLAGRPEEARPAGGVCPHHREGKCVARHARALGCRLFYCGPAGEQWFPDAYERYHQRIRRLHERYGVPYLYVDFSR